MFKSVFFCMPEYEVAAIEDTVLHDNIEDSIIDYLEDHYHLTSADYNMVEITPEELEVLTLEPGEAVFIYGGLKTKLKKNVFVNKGTLYRYGDDDLRDYQDDPILNLPVTVTGWKRI